METRIQELFADLNEEIENLEARARRIEVLVRHLPPSARRQWDATSNARLAYEEQLRKLLNAILGEE
jgi:hypothetical protein